MTIKEMKESYKGQYADVEVYELTSKIEKLHSDCIEHVEDYSEDAKIDIVLSGLLDKDDYDSTVFANCSNSFTDIYEESDKVLVLVLEK